MLYEMMEAEKAVQIQRHEDLQNEVSYLQHQLNQCAQDLKGFVARGEMPKDLLTERL